MVQSEQVFRRMRLRELLLLLRHIQALSVQESLSVRYSELKRKNSETGAATVENTAQRQDVQDEWDGLMQLQAVTDAVYRGQRK